MRTVVLQITSFAGISIGGEHFYGKIYYHDENGELQTSELERFVTDKEELEYLSKKGGYKCDPDIPTYRFNTPQDIRNIALEAYKTLDPSAVVLLEGRYAVADPQRVLDAPKDLMEIGNKLYDEAEDIDWYEVDGERMEEISDAWCKLFR